MGSASSKSSKNKLNSSTTSKDESCCCFFIIRWCCSSSKSSTSSDSSSFSIDDKYLPSFDRLSINHKNRFENKEKLNFTSEQIENRYQKSYLKSIENFENSLHSSSSIDQWINALSPIAPASSNRIESTKNFSVGEHFRRPEKVKRIDSCFFLRSTIRSMFPGKFTAETRRTLVFRTNKKIQS